MSFEHLDLDITHYTLQDMLQLLGLPVGFTKQHLKESMKVVGSLHPDKSGAPPGVYQLFYQAHLQCRQLLAAREKGNRRALIRDDYTAENERQIAEEMSKRDDFNSWFNESFQEFHKTEYQKSAGHGEWLVSENEGGSAPRISNLQQMAGEMTARRKEAVAREQSRALMLADGPIAAEVGSGTLLIQDEQTAIEASGGSVGDVAFSDVRHGYEESLVPVDENHRPEYSNLNELEAARGGLDGQAMAFWRDYDKQGEAARRAQEQRVSTDARMFALQREQEEQMQAHSAWRSRMLALTHQDKRK